MSDPVIELTKSGLRLHGEFDAALARRLDSALRRMERQRRGWEVDFTFVTFVDSHGLTPIAESVRRCRQLRRPELVLRPNSVVRRVLYALHVAHDPFDLHAWDAAAEYGQRRRRALTA